MRLAHSSAKCHIVEAALQAAVLTLNTVQAAHSDRVVKINNSAVAETLWWINKASIMLFF